MNLMAKKLFESFKFKWSFLTDTWLSIFLSPLACWKLQRAEAQGGEVSPKSSVPRRRKISSRHPVEAVVE